MRRSIERNVFAKCVDVHQQLGRKLLSQGTINIHSIPHHVSFFNSKTQQNGLACVTTFTSKPRPYLIIENKKIDISAFPYLTSLNFEKTQYFTKSLASPEIIREAELVKLSKLITKRDIFTNISLVALERIKNVEIFLSQSVEVCKFPNNILLCDALTSPRLFNLLNTNNKFVVESIAEMKNIVHATEYETVKYVMKFLADLNPVEYEKLLIARHEEKEGLISKLYEQMLNE